VGGGAGAIVRGGDVAPLCGVAVGTAVDVALGAGVGAVLTTGDGDALATEAAARLVTAAVDDPHPARVRSAVVTVIRPMPCMSFPYVELRKVCAGTRGDAQRPKVLRRARAAPPWARRVRARGGGTRRS